MPRKRFLPLMGCLAALLTTGETARGRTFNVGELPLWVAVADLDGDAHPDVVTADQESDQVSVLFGTGGGAFQSAVTFAVDNAPRSVAIADLDGDTFPDLITANQGNFQSSNYVDIVSVRLGNGDGTFQAAVGYGAGQNLLSLAVADIDGDTDLDLVTGGGSWPFSHTSTGYVSLFRGNGDGTLQAPTTILQLQSLVPAAVALADLDDDTALDLLVSNIVGTEVRVLLGNGNGTFQAPSSFSTGSGPNSIAIADLDGDDALDMVTANFSSPTASVLLGNGDGTFQAATSVAAGGQPRSVAAAHLDGGTNLDLAVANQSSDTVSVLLGNGDGTFSAAPPVATRNGPVAVSLADLNGDGLNDLIVANSYSDDVTVLLGNGDGSFGQASAVPALSPGALALVAALLVAIAGGLRRTEA